MDRCTVSSFQLPSLAKHMQSAKQVMGALSFYWKISLVSPNGQAGIGERGWNDREGTMVRGMIERVETSRRRLFGLGLGVAAGGFMRGDIAARAQSAATPVAAHPDFRVRFVRHAESQINELGAIEAPGQSLPSDSGVTYPLTQRGVEQAIALAASLRDDPILAVVSSPRLRCTQTADAIAFAKALTIELAPGLVEVAFVDPAASMSTLDYVAMLQTMTSWVTGDRSAHTPGGESLDDVLARFLPVVTETIGLFAGQPGDLLFVSHSIVLSVALPFLFSNLSPEWALANVLPNTGIATGGYVAGALTCTDWNGSTPG
jgi:broad specificity phosphatase PhoE